MSIESIEKQLDGWHRDRLAAIDADMARRRVRGRVILPYPEPYEIRLLLAVAKAATSAAEANYNSSVAFADLDQALDALEAAQ